MARMEQEIADSCINYEPGHCKLDFVDSCISCGYYSPKTTEPMSKEQRWLPEID